MIRSDHWNDRIAQFKEENKSIKPHSWFFLGDSITEEFPIESYFNQQNIYNRGIGGDTIDGLIERFSVSIPDKGPQKVFLMIGINNIGAGINEDILKKQYEKLTVKLSNRKNTIGIYWNSILPSRKEWPSNKPEIIKSLNSFIENICKKERFTFINLYPIFADDTDQLKIELTYDGLHLSKNGYDLFAAEINKILQNEN